MKQLFKTLSLCILALCAGYSLLDAQVVVVQGEPEAPLPNSLNEVRLNLLMPVAFKSISLEYERAILKDLGVGAALTSCLAKADDRENYLVPRFGVMPYARWYFGGKKLSMARPNSGFFLEANTALNFIQYSDWSNKDSSNTPETKSGVSWGIGLGFGWKFVSRSNWSGEIGLRAGRNLLKVAGGNEAYVHPAISVGYRF